MIVKIIEKTLLVLRNRTYINVQFDAQNAGYSVSELPDFKFFWGKGEARPQTPLAKEAEKPLVNRYTLPPTSDFIETVYGLYFDIAWPFGVPLWRLQWLFCLFTLSLQ